MPSNSSNTSSPNLTPVSRQLGEFVDRLNETRSPATPLRSSHSSSASSSSSSSAPINQQQQQQNQQFTTPPPRKGSNVGIMPRVKRTESMGSPEDMAYDLESSKLTPVSRQLGEFVERLNQGRSYLLYLKKQCITSII